MACMLHLHGGYGSVCQDLHARHGSYLHVQYREFFNYSVPLQQVRGLRKCRVDLCQAIS